MEKRVEILNELISCDIQMGDLISQLEMFENSANELMTLIIDESQWSGEAQKKCVEIHKLIISYEKGVHTICQTYKDEIHKLIENTQAFKYNSDFVKSLKGI